MTATADRIVPVAGDGLVARWPSGTVVLGGSPTEVAAALHLLRNGSGEPSADELLERLRSCSAPHLAGLVVVPGGRRLVGRGAGAATSLSTGNTHLAGAAGEVVEAFAPTEPLWLGFGPVPFDHDAIRQSLVGLGAGVVPGRGVIVEPVAGDPIAPSPEPAPASFEIADLSPSAVADPLPVLTRAEPSPPSPNPADEPHRAIAELGGVADVAVGQGALVKGIECSRGHFNNPSGAYCSSCGISLVHLTHRLVDGVRPALGFLVFDDGSTFALDRSYLIGRDPEPTPGSGLTPLAATDAEQSVSRAHAELILEGWDARLNDLGSTNGTFVWRDEQQRWEPVLPNRSVLVPAGTRVAVGRRTFVFESLARSV